MGVKSWLDVVVSVGAKMCILIWTNTPLKLIPAITIGHRVLPNRFALFKGHGLARENYVKKIADCLTRSNFHLCGAKHLASLGFFLQKIFKYQTIVYSYAKSSQDDPVTG